MKSYNLKSLIRYAAFAIIPLLALSSCEDESSLEPIASFQYETSESNFLDIVFTNFSENAVSYSWDFGDGETSTEENPTHTYAETGTYTVVLTAMNEDDISATYQQEIEVTDPNEALTLLAGEVSKTWRLYRV
ncbi:MAG TPA: PKD domain-containing protein, partial [Bacteroidales bacterium]|nr:PKD domain-containing protein [Bacteroidales bacterium]